MTPSEAHNSAWQRDAGHDEMVIGVMNWFKKRKQQWDWKSPETGEEVEGNLVRVEVEKHCTGSGRSFFIDICLVYEAMEETYKLRHAVCLEVKPTIHSAGALMRQLAFQNVNLKQYLRYEATFENFLVVDINDEKKQHLDDMMDTIFLVWDS